MKLTLKKALPLFILVLSCSLNTQAQVDDSNSDQNAYNLKKIMTERFAPMKEKHIIYAVVTDKVMEMIEMAGDAYNRNPTPDNYRTAKKNFMELMKTLESNTEPSPKLYQKNGQMVINTFSTEITMSSLERTLATHCPMYPFCD
ncbi:MAG: hypothetical protein R2800_07735 [Flavipsychrobacter sp.]